MEESIIGRTGELETLNRLFTRAAYGDSQVVLVGPAGIGKTALTRHCLASWQARAVSASGDPDETCLSGGLLDQLAQEAAVPEAKELVGLLDPGAADPLSAGSALLGMFHAMAASEPLVALVDDVQWGDELSLRALSFAGRRLRHDPVLCILVTRGEDLNRLPPGLLRLVDDRGTRLDLGPLNAADVAALAEQAPGVAAAPGGRAAAGTRRRYPLAREGTAARLAR